MSYPLTFHDVKQNTPEWFQLRAGLITMSELHKIMASAREFLVVQLSSSEFGVLNVANKKVYKKTYKTKEDAEKFSDEQTSKYDSKEFGSQAKQYAIELANEQISGKPTKSHLNNPHLLRGHEEEPLARARYERENFVDVIADGFYCNDFIGWSPDGRLNNGINGAIEILSCISSVHYENVERKSYFPPKKWQLIGAMKYAKLDWIDFVSYCDDYPEDFQLYTYRMKYDDYLLEYDMIETRVSEFRSFVEEKKESILNSEYFHQ